MILEGWMRSCLEEQSLPVSPEERAAGAFRNTMILPGKDVNSSFASFYLEFFEENHRCLQGNRWKLQSVLCNRSIRQCVWGFGQLTSFLRYDLLSQ